MPGISFLCDLNRDLTKDESTILRSLDSLIHTKQYERNILLNKKSFYLAYTAYKEYPLTTFENDKLQVLGFNSCIIDETAGRLGRGNTSQILSKVLGSDKLSIIAFHHTIVPLPRTKHDSDLMDAGDVLSALVQNRINLVLTGAKNKAGCWQIDDTIFVNAGTLSSYNLTTRDGNSFNIIDLYKTDKGIYYEIDEYLIEKNKRRNIGLFHVSDIVKPIKVPVKIV